MCECDYGRWATRGSHTGLLCAHAAALALSLIGERLNWGVDADALRRETQALGSHLSRAVIALWATEAVMARGEEIAASPAIDDVRHSGDEYWSYVMGTDDYRVGVWLRDGEVSGSCTCPAWLRNHELGLVRSLCKHQVAVALRAARERP